MRAWIPLAALAAACRPATDDVDGAVFVLVLDGVRAEESFGDRVSQAAGVAPPEILPESWARLVPRAARGTSAWNIGLPVTAQAHAAIASGLRQRLGNYAVEEGDEPGLYRPELPGVLEAARDQLGLPRERALLMANTTLVQPVVHSNYPGAGYEQSADFHLVTPPEDDPLVFEHLKARILEHHPRFVLVNMHQADRAGHYGDGPAYEDAVRALDTPLADFWDWLQEQPAYADDAWLFVLADHGRHLEADTDPPWRHHGDGCLGCRHLPLLALGPGVQAARAVDATITLPDIASTAAALLGLSLPWSEGLVAEDLFEAPPEAPAREGVAAIEAAGGHVAELRFQADPRHRKALFLDGALVSDPAALDVEEPAMASGEGASSRTWLCWRELILDPGGYSGWVPRCLGAAGDGWEDIGGPTGEVSGFWQPRLVDDDGALLLVYPRNLLGIVTTGQGDGAVSMVAARYDGVWRQDRTEASLSFPTDPVVMRVGGDAFVAFGNAMGGEVTGRHLRRIFVAPLWRQDRGGLIWGDLTPIQMDDRYGAAGEWRLERPAMAQRGDGVALAAIATTAEGNRMAMIESTDGLQGWGSTQEAPAADVLPHLQPVWAGDRVIFGALEGGLATLCAWGGGEALSCLDVGSPRILGLSVDGDVVRAVVDVGEASWSVLEVEADAI